jgi:hypothetical protein
MQKNLQIQQSMYFFEMKYKNALYDDDGGGLEGNGFGRGFFVVEDVFLAFNGFALNEPRDVVVEGFFVNGLGQIEIFHPQFVRLLLVPWAVVIVLGNDADFIPAKALGHAPQKTGLSRAAASGDANDVGFRHRFLKVWAKVGQYFLFGKKKCTHCVAFREKKRPQGDSPRPF